MADSSFNSHLKDVPEDYDYFQSSKLYYDKEECEEYSNSSYEHPDIHESRMEHAPTRWHIIPMDGCHDDHESLEPHPDIHYDG